MKKPNSAEIFYFILRSIETSTTGIHLDNCEKLINGLGKRYGFADYLALELLLKRCELLTKRYPVYE